VHRNTPYKPPLNGRAEKISPALRVNPMDAIPDKTVAPKNGNNPAKSPSFHPKHRPSTETIIPSVQTLKIFQELFSSGGV